MSGSDQGVTRFTDQLSQDTDFYFDGFARTTHVVTPNSDVTQWVYDSLGNLEAIYDYVIAHIEIDFRRELRHGDREVLVRCRLDRLGSSSVRTREEVLTREGGKDALLHMSAQIAACHHERWDGTGYPQKLAGNAIPLPARIVAVADVYDALTTDRPYKPALAHREAVKIIRSRRGAQFEPLIVDAFLAVEHEFDRLRRELASEESPRVYADAA